MILVDTSVWVDHLRRGDAGLVALLERADVLMHPFVVGEMACGSLRDRESILELLQDLPAAVVASPEEVLKFIKDQALHGKGIGYVDVHLLASVALTAGARLWTRDTRLRRIADLMGCSHTEPTH
ncbi:MAG: type II toxin-antitoxin system VapC family toxin [Betaproteobacteria bacterium]